MIVSLEGEIGRRGGLPFPDEGLDDREGVRGDSEMGWSTGKVNDDWLFRGGGACARSRERGGTPGAAVVMVVSDDWDELCYDWCCG